MTFPNFEHLTLMTRRIKPSRARTLITLTRIQIKQRIILRTTNTFQYRCRKIRTTQWTVLHVLVLLLSLVVQLDVIGERLARVKKVENVWRSYERNRNANLLLRVIGLASLTKRAFVNTFMKDFVVVLLLRAKS